MPSGSAVPPSILPPTELLELPDLHVPSLCRRRFIKRQCPDENCRFWGSWVFRAVHVSQTGEAMERSRGCGSVRRFSIFGFTPFFLFAGCCLERIVCRLRMCADQVPGIFLTPLPLLPASEGPPAYSPRAPSSTPSPRPFRETRSGLWLRYPSPPICRCTRYYYCRR